MYRLDFCQARQRSSVRVRSTAIACVLGATLASAPLAVVAQDGLFDYQEFEKRVKGAQSLSAISTDAVFGDRTSSFDGSTQFVVEDVSIPGNFDLPVSLTRQHSVESTNRAVDGSEATGLNIFDDWEVQVPYLSGVWTTASGWVTGNGASLTTQRCSTNVAPNVIDGHAYADLAFGIDVRWHGGAAEELLIPDDPGYASAPGLPSPKWMTSSRARFTCLSATRNGYPGEGFVGHTPDGKKYYFDWGVEKPYAILKYSDGAANRIVGRKRVYLLASRVEDRYGNWVSYGYDGYRLVSIDASDGRRISLTYDGQGRVTTATANGRVWRYGYAAGDGKSNGGLARVDLPDGSFWRYIHSGHLRSRGPYRHADDDDQCAIRAGSAPPPYSMTVVSPSGAQGVFDFAMELFIRSDPCNGLQPAYYDTWALNTRTISGPGLPNIATHRNYKLQLPGSDRGKWVSQSRADGTLILERYGTDPATDERKLLQRQVLDAAGQVVRDEQHTYLHGAADGPFPIRVGRSLGLMSGQFLAGTLSATRNSQVMQDGDTYVISLDGFDRYSRAHAFTYSGPSGARTETREYHDSPSPWVLDQVLRVREASTGTVTAEYSYDARAKPVASYRAGLLQQTLEYAGDGNVSVVRDANGNPTLVSGWHRGVPQRVVNADGTSTQMQVDDNGWISAVTDESGRTTSYGYDALGRVTEIRPPADENDWLATTLSFRQMQLPEFGLGPGHWRVDTAQGSRRDETYLDALWRPVVTRSYDANDITATERFVRTMFDSEGREVFQSYPARTSEASSGIWSQHDALGRTTSTGEDSEHGVLVTTYTYLPRATVTRTDPAGHNTITQFHAIDAPDYEKPSHIIRPDGSRIRIARNALGLTTEVAQSAN